MAVVGAGAVGAALAGRLADLGYRVALIDAQARPRPTGRIVALAQSSLDELDFGDAVAAVPIREVRLRTPEGALWLRAHEAGAEALGACLALDELVAALRAQAARRVRTLWPARLAALEAGADEVRLHLVGPRGGRRMLRARLVIAADGAGAEVARLAGFRSRLGWSHNRFALTAFVRLARPPFGAALERLGREPLVLLPWREGEYALVWTLPPDAAWRRLREPDEAFLAHLAAAVGGGDAAAFGAPAAVRARRTVPLALALAPPAVRGRVWLAGASAHHLHPIAAQGLNLGLRDARAIADILARPWAKADPGAPVAGETYAQRRAPDIAATVAFTEALWLAHAPDDPCTRAARRLGLAALAARPDLRAGLLARLALARNGG